MIEKQKAQQDKSELNMDTVSMSDVQFQDRSDPTREKLIQKDYPWFQCTDLGIEIELSKAIENEGSIELTEWRCIAVRLLQNSIDDAICEVLLKKLDTRPSKIIDWNNNQSLCVEIYDSIYTFLEDLWYYDILAGETRKEAFYIICDETNNSIEQRELGQLHVNVGIALLRPNEFLILNFQFQEKNFSADN